MRRRNSIASIGELLEVIKALEDADYWGPPPSSQKDYPVFDTPPAEFGAFNETDDWCTPPPSRSKSKPKDKGKGKSNQLVCESQYLPFSRPSLYPIDHPHPATHFDFSSKPSPSGLTHKRGVSGRATVAMTLLAGGLAAGLKGGAAVTGMSYILPIASLLLLTVNIRDAGVRLLTRLPPIS
jgi:hypothetical protein